VIAGLFAVEMLVPTLRSSARSSVVGR